MFQLLLNEQKTWVSFQSESCIIVLDMPVNIKQDFNKPCLCFLLEIFQQQLKTLTKASTVPKIKLSQCLTLNLNI